MSFIDTSGTQVDPLDLVNTPQALAPDEYADAPTPVDQDGEPVTVVRFADGSSTITTATAMCESMGVGTDQYHAAMAGLLASGWLTLLADGSYLATIPGGEQ